MQTALYFCKELEQTSKNTMIDIFNKFILMISSFGHDVGHSVQAIQPLDIMIKVYWNNYELIKRVVLIQIGRRTWISIITKSEVDFIQVIVRPCYVLLSEFLEGRLKHCIGYIDDTIQYWEKQ